MFLLKGPIGQNSPTDPEDSGLIKHALTALGYYDDTQTGLSPYPDRALFQSIKGFQKAHGLEINGVIYPNGPTQKTIKNNLKTHQYAGNAFLDFRKNFDDMNETNFKSGDKYFHCKANYEATHRGWGSDAIATALSDAKELKDKIFRNYSDGEQDQFANRTGREAARSKKFESAKDACAIFRPEGLDEKY